MTHEPTGVDTTEPTAPHAPDAPGTPDAPAKRPPRARLLLAGLLALCVLAAVGGYLLIDKLSDHGPATPQAAVTGFLNALLTDRDPDKAREYVCESIRDSDFAANLDAITAAEQASGRHVDIVWNHVTTTGETGDTATVTADVSSTTSQGPEAQTWTFTVIKDAEWYVCGFATPH